MSDETTWINGREAFQLLCRCGNPATAAHRFREPLRRGRIDAVALDGTLHHRRNRGSEEVSDWPVLAETWKGTVDNSLFRLSEGVYSSSALSTGYSRVELSGLRFNRQQIISYFEIADDGPQEQAEAPGEVGAEMLRTGRPVEKELWGNLTAALGAYAQSGGDIRPGEHAGTLYARVTSFGSTLGLTGFIGLDSCRAYLNLAMELVHKAENGSGTDPT